MEYTYLRALNKIYDYKDTQCVYLCGMIGDVNML